MSLKIITLKKIYIAILALCIGAIFFSLLSIAYFEYREIFGIFNAGTYVEEIDSKSQNTFIAIRDSLDEIIEQGGIQGAIDVNTYAFQQKKYGLYHCHVLMHLIGHESVVYYGLDYESVMSQHIEYCAYGYQHGAEAEIVLRGGAYQEELYKLCRLIKQNNPQAQCFHGAGHAFLSETLDVPTSLELCEALKSTEFGASDLATCYNSVFAELTNLVGGSDGGTGEPITGGPPIVLEEKTSLEYCAKFERKYTIECLFEFSGLGVGLDVTDAYIESRINECAQDAYDHELQSACVRSVAAVGVQHQLIHRDLLPVPKSIHTLPDYLRRAYIQGAGGEMNQYIMVGVSKDWRAFCDTFSDKTEHKLCADIFQNI